MTKLSPLPSPLSRSARGGPLLKSILVSVEVVTPILGGSSQTRAIDNIDVIRAATVRGHLRFWWRALYAAQYATAGELYERESEIWGRAASKKGGRSAVGIRIDIKHTGEIDTTDVRLNDSRDGKATPGAYALWPAREERNKSTPPAPRRMPGTRFRLAVVVPTGFETEVLNALRAWILFGGYGSRTRRGLGTLKALDDVGASLPRDASRDALTNFFGFDVFAAPAKIPGLVPWLAGAALHVGAGVRDAMHAWTTALDWLREFRQGASGARQPDPSGKNQRPSISNWPEADKIRRLSSAKNGLQWAHRPRHDDTPAWPRAGFGLPIIGQFQQQSRDTRPGWKKGDRRARYLYWNELGSSHPNYGTEPDGFELRWRSGNTEHDRLASPLIVKALPLADGTFVPCALWLNRAYPVGEVILRGVARSQAPFDRLVAPEDKPQFSALANKQSLRQAFLDWLHAKYRTTVVAS